MPIVRIEDATDARLREFIAVSDSELARAHGLFVAEGRLVLRRVIEHGAYGVRSVLVNDAARRSLATVLERLSPDVPVYVCAPRTSPSSPGSTSTAAASRSSNAQPLGPSTM